METEILKCQKSANVPKKMFLMIFGTKINLWMPNLIFQSLPRDQNIKIRAVNNTAMTQASKNMKHNVLFSHFSVPGRTIWGHLSIDLGLSCLEHFFWVRCGSNSVPNELICFHQFSHFLRFDHFCDFEHFSLFSSFFNFWNLFYPPTHLFYSGELKIA